jgi:hypothetical protein
MLYSISKKYVMKCSCNFTVFMYSCSYFAPVSPATVQVMHLTSVIVPELNLFSDRDRIYPSRPVEFLCSAFR